MVHLMVCFSPQLKKTVHRISQNEKNMNTVAESNNHVTLMLEYPLEHQHELLTHSRPIRRSAVTETA